MLDNNGTAYINNYETKLYIFKKYLIILIP